MPRGEDPGCLLHTPRRREVQPRERVAMVATSDSRAPSIRAGSARNCASGSGPELPAAAPTFPAKQSEPAVPATARPSCGSAARLEPIASERHVLRVTVGAAFVADLEAVRQALSHAVPGGALEEVLHECLRWVDPVP